MAIAYDIAQDGHGQNMLGGVGFLNAIAQCCRLSPGSAALFAPVCSSFVYMPLAQIALKRCPPKKVCC